MSTPPLFHLATAVIRAPDGSVLLRRRPATGLLARMWSLPASEVGEPDAAAAAVVEIARSLVGAVPLERAVELGTIDHRFSHRRERYLCWRIDIAQHSIEAGADVTWIGADLSGYALPAAQRRILGLAQRLPTG